MQNSTLPSSLAEQNELAVLNLVHMYSHLRRIEIARGVWKDARPREADKMAERTIKSLRRRKELLTRINPFGGLSFTLGGRGTKRLRCYGYAAPRGRCSRALYLDPQFSHRMLGARYLIERSTQGHEAYGEYALDRGWTPIPRRELGPRFARSPDGVVLVPGQERGRDASIRAADWVEVVSSLKVSAELAQIFHVARNVGAWLVPERVMLDRVVLVYNDFYRYERTIFKALQRYLLAHPTARDALLPNIVLARCRIEPRLTWSGHDEIDCARMLAAQSPILGDYRT
jgi:hypothetical protein